MPSSSSQRPPAGDRDWDILEHLMCHRLTTPEVLQRLFFPDTDRNAVTKVTSRLCQREYLLSHALFGSHTYLTLGRAGARVMGLSQKRIGPLGPQALYSEYGVLAFCCRHDPPRHKFRVREIAEKFPSYLHRKLRSSHYYADVEEQTRRLGYIWVEGGGSIDHIRRTVQGIIEQRQAIPIFRQAIEQQRFVVAVVTCSDEKQQAITDALRALRTAVYFRIEAVPELIHLLPGLRHA